MAQQAKLTLVDDDSDAAEIAALVARSRAAQAQIENYTQEQVNALIRAMVWAVAKPGVAEKIAQDLQARFALDYAWKGDQVEFRRPGCSGRLVVGQDQFALDVNLNFLLTPLRPAIEREIVAQLDQLVGGGKADDALRAYLEECARRKCPIDRKSTRLNSSHT